MNESYVFKINRVKNHYCIIFLSLILLLFIILCLIFENYVALILICLYCGYSIYKMFIEYKAVITINLAGIYSVRNNKFIQMKWENIKTIQIKENKRMPLLDCMTIIDIEEQKIYIDFNILGYYDAWRIIKAIAKKHSNILFINRDSSQAKL